MAAGRGRSQGRPGRGEIPEADRVIDAALRLIAAQGWRHVSLAAVASEAGLPVLQVYRAFPSKTSILCGFFRRVDEAALAVPPEAAADERPRDRVFDLLMRRFDALQPHRTTLEALRRDLPTDPPTVLALGAGLLCSMRLMLEAAGIPCHGIAGAIAVKLTAACFLAASHTWARDESPDLALTMAALDRRLRGIERWLSSGRRAREDRSAAQS